MSHNETCIAPSSYKQIPFIIFSEATQRSGILNPWIWLANDVCSSGPEFPIQTPHMDRSNPRENLKWNPFTPAQQNIGFFFLKSYGTFLSLTVAKWKEISAME